MEMVNKESSLSGIVSALSFLTHSFLNLLMNRMLDFVSLHFMYSFAGFCNLYLLCQEIPNLKLDSFVTLTLWLVG